MARTAIVPAGVLFLAALAPLPAADKAAPLSSKEIYQKVLKSAVWIAHAKEVGDGRIGVATGTGSLIDAEKKILITNVHVVGNQDVVAVFFPEFDTSKKLVSIRDHYMNKFRNGGGLKGKVLHRDSKRDLALVQLTTLPQGVTAVPLARDSVGPGDSVHSIGNPGASGALWAYSPGSVKAVYPKKWEVIDRDERSHRYEAQVVETTSPVNPGDSGGPLVNGNAELVGVTQGGAISQNAISFFIDISEVRTVLAARKIRINNPSAAVASNTEPKSDEKPKDPGVSEADRTEITAQNKLNFAEQYRDRPSRYREKLEEVVKLYPNTKAAKQAKDILAKLKA